MWTLPGSASPASTWDRRSSPSWPCWRVSSEYSTGTIRTTLTALPRRPGVLAAKAVTVGGVTLAVGTIAVLGCLLVGRFVLPGQGLTPAHGYPLLSLGDGPTLRAAAGSVLYLALIALLSLGIAAAVRSSAAAIGIVLGLLYLFPILAAVVADPHWQRHLQQIGPMTAGLAIQATVNLHEPAHQPLGWPWRARRLGRGGAARRRTGAGAARRIGAPSTVATSRMGLPSALPVHLLPPSGVLRRHAA